MKLKSVKRRRRITKALTTIMFVVVFLLVTHHSLPATMQYIKSTVANHKEITTSFEELPGYKQAKELFVKDAFEPVKLESVVDGDTIVCTRDGEPNSFKVRLIGVDTPESVHVDASRNNIYGTMASDYTKQLLKDIGTVYLMYDIETVDQYGRVLAYVWLKEDVDPEKESDIQDYMLNAMLVKHGYAFSKVFMPNNHYEDYFEKLKEEARENSAGLWQYPEFADLWK